MATQPDLGITDPYALDQAQFDAAMALLTQQKDLISEYWSDYTKAVQAFSSGSSAVGTSWQVIANIAAGEGAPVMATKAKEGATGWSDTWMIAKDTPNINCAYKWVDYIASPEANAQVAEYFGEAPSNAKACELTSDKTFCETYHAGDTEYWKDVYYWNTPTAELPRRAHGREVRALQRVGHGVERAALLSAVQQRISSEGMNQ